MPSLPTAIFVYGTLKRGEVRERTWPRVPLSVTEASVRGCLYDLGPYPALVEGGDQVGGELWQFSVDDLPVTLAALDDVESYSGGPDDLYRRVIVECETGSGIVRAWVYRYARERELSAAKRIEPDHVGVCRWKSTK
jgi:gamma-glutamylcyclotransferase (GGCT)/AIG2-like uncharacterized protein YtfP